MDPTGMILTIAALAVLCWLLAPVRRRPGRTPMSPATPGKRIGVGTRQR